MTLTSVLRVTASALVLGGLVACGGGGGSSRPAPTPAPAPAPAPPPANTAPVVTSAASVSVAENTTDAFYTLVATDADNDALSFALDSSAEAAFFRFDPATQELFPASAFDFETPNDDNADNIYALSFTVTDNAGGTTPFTLAVTVTDEADNGAFGLQASLPPSGNFDLLDWKLDLPVNDEGGLSGRSATVDERDLAMAYTSEWFFTGPDGGMVLRAPPGGATTSAGTQFARTELREMLRRDDRSIRTRGVNANNWVLSSAPTSAQAASGNVDGVLRVSMAVNEVTETGSRGQVGRIIIGQIHAETDEPIRLYYRKLPGNTHGVIYAIHEISEGADVDYPIIGTRSNDEPNPANGFLLDEVFEYVIDTRGNFIDVTINDAEGNTVGTTTIDMTDSGYDVADDWMYFKAGNYHVNNTADADDFAQVTIYALDNTHDTYTPPAE